MSSLSSLCLNNFPHRFGQRVNFRISFKRHVLCAGLYIPYVPQCRSRKIETSVFGQIVTQPYLFCIIHHGKCLFFFKFHFLYHSSYELCYSNVSLVMSHTSICIVFLKSFMGVSTIEELRHAISACKDLINTTSDDSEEKRKLITKLVQLRLKLQESQVCRCMIYFSRDLMVKHY